MREIKFRAWFKNECEMKNVATNNVYEGNKTYLHLSPMPISDYKAIELMQYTGIKDVNGREIYEGDIIHHFEPNYDMSGGLIDYDDTYEVVRWNKVTGGFELLLDVLIQPTVCGNIYENPELLEG